MIIGRRAYFLFATATIGERYVCLTNLKFVCHFPIISLAIDGFEHAPVCDVVLLLPNLRTTNSMIN